MKCVKHLKHRWYVSPAWSAELKGRGGPIRALGVKCAKGGLPGGSSLQMLLKAPPSHRLHRNLSMNCFSWGGPGRGKQT